MEHWKNLWQSVVEVWRVQRNFILLLIGLLILVGVVVPGAIALTLTLPMYPVSGQAYILTLDLVLVGGAILALRESK